MTNKVLFSQQGKRYQSDVLVVGSGIAALTYVLELLKIKPNCNITLITKKELEVCNSSYAQGGIAAATGETNSIESHVADTIAAGDSLANLEVVKEFLSHGSQSVKFLTDYDVSFDRDNANYDLTKEGGHSERRVYHVGDRTGEAIINALICKI